MKINTWKWLAGIALIIGSFALTVTSVRADADTDRDADRRGAGKDLVTLSLDPSSPLTEMVPVSNPATRSYFSLPVLVFDIVPSKEALTLRSVTVEVASPIGGSGGTLSAAYLYQGPNIVASSTVVNGQATFAVIRKGIRGAFIPKGTTVPYTVKVDVMNVGQGQGFTVVAGVLADGVHLMAADRRSKAVRVSGSAIGSYITVAGPGAAFSLSGSPEILKSVSGMDNNGNETMTYMAMFDVAVTAIGEPVALGLPSFAKGPAFGPSSFVVLENGVPTAIDATVAYTYPPNTELGIDGTYFTVGINQTVVVPVVVSFTVLNPGPNAYSVQEVGAGWLSPDGFSFVDTFMEGEPAWRTPSI